MTVTILVPDVSLITPILGVVLAITLVRVVRWVLDILP
jgi:hypothetical protein